MNSSPHQVTNPNRPYQESYPDGPGKTIYPGNPRYPGFPVLDICWKLEDALDNLIYFWIEKIPECRDNTAAKDLLLKMKAIQTNLSKRSRGVNALIVNQCKSVSHNASTTITKRTVNNQYQNSSYFESSN